MSVRHTLYWRDKQRGPCIHVYYDGVSDETWALWNSWEWQVPKWIARHWRKYLWRKS